MSESGEPRTTADIVSGLLEFVQDREWSDDVHTSGDYYEKGCGECGALEDHGEHRRGCLRASMISEARAFIAAEREAEVRPVPLNDGNGSWHRLTDSAREKTRS